MLLLYEKANGDKATVPMADTERVCYLIARGGKNPWNDVLLIQLSDKPGGLVF